MIHWNVRNDGRQLESECGRFVINRPPPAADDPRVELVDRKYPEGDDKRVILFYREDTAQLVADALANSDI
jgi:hypothetical protein